MKSKSKNRFSLLTQTALASTLFCCAVSMPAHAQLTNLTTTGQDSSTVPATTGYNYDADSITFSIVSGTTSIGNTGGISVDNNNGNPGTAFKGSVLNFNNTAPLTTVTGTVGPTNPIGTINVDTSGNQINFAGNVTLSGSLNFLTNDIVSLVNTGLTFTGNIDNLTGTPNQGLFNTEGSSTINGNIGQTSPIASFEGNSATIGQTVTLTGSSINAQTILMNHNPSNNSTLVLNNGSMIVNGDLQSAALPAAFLNILSANTINGNVGTALGFANIFVGQNGNTTINGSVLAFNNTQFNGDFTLTLGSSALNSITGPVITASPGSGKLAFSGGYMVNDTIGAAGTPLDSVTLEGASGSTVTFNAAVIANSIIFTGTGTGIFLGEVGDPISPTTLEFQANGTAQIGNGTSNININGNVDGGGNLIFTGPSNEVTGTVGAVTSLNTIQIQNANTSVTFDQNVTSNTVELEGTGQNVAFDQNLTTNDLLFKAANESVTMTAANATITGNVDAAVTGTNSSLVFDGGGGITGNIGQSNAITNLLIDKTSLAGSIFTLSGTTINITNIALGDDGSTPSTLVLNNANMVLTTTAITPLSSKLDILGIEAANTINGTIGIGTAPFELVGIESNVIINGDIHAANTEFFGDFTLTLGDNFDINGPVTTETPTTGGNLILSSGNTVTGQIGAMTNPLNSVTLAGLSPTTTTLSSPVFASNINFTGTGIGDFFADINGNINFFANGLALIQLGININGSVNNLSGIPDIGNLIFLGTNMVSGSVGSTNFPLNAISLVDTGPVTFQQNVSANEITIISSTTTGIFDGNLTGDILFDDNGTVIMADGTTIDGNISASVAGNGNVEFQGGGTVTGNIGSLGISTLTVNSLMGANKIVTLEGSIVEATNIVIDDDTITPTTLVLNNPAMILTGNINGMTAGLDILDIQGASTTITGNIGNTGALGLIEVGGNVLMNGNIFATLTQFQNNSTLTLGNGKSINGAVDSLTPTTGGNLAFLGTSTVTGPVGAVNPLNTITSLGTSANTVTFNDVLNAANINFTGTANGVFGGDVSATTILLAGTTLNTFTFNAAVDATTINFSSNGKATFNDIVDASNFNFSGTGTGIFNDNVNSNINFLANANAQFADSVTITGNINNPTSTPSLGNLIFQGNATVDGNIGTTNTLNSIQFKGSTKTVDFNGTVNVANVTFSGSETANFNEATTITTSIKSTSPNNGILNFFESTNIIAPITGHLSQLNFNASAGSVLTINNNIAVNNTNVNNGGTLLANNVEMITGNLTINKGILSVTPSAEPLTINGNFNLNTGTTLNVNLNNTLTAGQVIVTGAGHQANINPGAKLTVSNVPAIVADGFHIFPIVTAPTPAGLNPIPASSSSLLLRLSTAVIGNSLDLIIDEIPPVIFADQPNTYGILGALGVIGSLKPPPGGTLGEILDQLNTFENINELNADAAALAPIVDGAVWWEAVAAQYMAYDAVRERLRNVTRPMALGYAYGDTTYNGRGTWGKIFGAADHQKERQAVVGYHDSMIGLTFGHDVMLSENNLLGFNFSWAHLNIEHDVSDATTKADSYQIGLYGQYEINDWWFANWDASVAYNDYNTQRSFVFGNLPLAPHDSYHGVMFGLHGEVGYEYICRMLHIIPVAQLFYSHLDLSGFTDQNLGNANQTVQSTDLDLLRGGAGVRLGLNYPYTKHHTTIILQPEVRLMAFYDFVTDTMQVTSQFVGAGPSFVTRGFKPKRELFNVGATLSTFSTSTPLIFTLNYDFAFNNAYISNSGFLRARYEW